MSVSEGFVLAMLTAVINGAVTWGVLKTQLKLMRHQINAAHRRLDLHGAPPAGGAALPE